MADMTTIWISQATKAALDELKIHPRETYDDVLRRLVDVARDHVEGDGGEKERLARAG